MCFFFQIVHLIAMLKLTFLFSLLIAFHINKYTLYTEESSLKYFDKAKNFYKSRIRVFNTDSQKKVK